MMGKVVKCGAEKRALSFYRCRFGQVRNELVGPPENDQRGTEERWDTAANDHSLDAPEARQEVGTAAAGGMRNTDAQATAASC
jgi:hypothetical protein